MKIIKEKYLECTTGGHNKFYRIAVIEHSKGWRLVFGGVDGQHGTIGQTQHKEFGLARSAKDNALVAMDIVVEKKESKGYKLLIEEEDAVFEEVKKTAPKKKAPAKSVVKAWAEEQWDIL